MNYQQAKEKYGKPKQILFSTEMVRAILDGRKTQTRRLNSLKKQPPNDYPFLGFVLASNNDENVGCGMWGIEDNPRPFCYRKPPYLTGDILYVRETFAVGKVDCGEEPDGRAVPYISQCKGEDNLIPKEWAIRNDVGIEEVRWKPSIHMPKEAARIFLKVTDVRVERLQDINIMKIHKEGFDSPVNEGHIARENFIEAWDGLYKEEGYGWDADPWVWVIEFEVIE